MLAYHAHMMPDPMPNSLPAGPSLADAWRWARAQLPSESEAGLIELFDRGLAISATALRAFSERRLNPSQTQSLEQLVQRRAAGEPLAYVLGRRGFWSLDLEVDQHTLIPRVETERLVELALLRVAQDASGQLVDLGTGSGAIALALAKERPSCFVLGVDRSLPALRVARRNAMLNGLERVRWLASDWMSALAERSFDLVVSNPPYIAEADPHLSQGDLRYEPASALSSGADGLRDIRRLIDDAPRCLRPGGWLLFEHGHDQGEAARALLLARGFEQVQTEQDLEQRDRVSLGQWNGK